MNDERDVLFDSGNHGDMHGGGISYGYREKRTHVNMKQRRGREMIEGIFITVMFVVFAILILLLKEAR